MTSLIVVALVLCGGTPSPDNERSVTVELGRSRWWERASSVEFMGPIVRGAVWAHASPERRLHVTVRVDEALGDDQGTTDRCARANRSAWGWLMKNVEPGQATLEVVCRYVSP